jgi:predicted enzyme related to lactoylglutathione lyase
MPRVVHFEIHTSDPERDVAFYEALFGWQFTRWQGGPEYWLIKTGTGEPGIDGGLLRRRGAAPAEGQPVNAFVSTVEVSRLDDTLARLAGLGGTVAVPKMPIPGVGWLAYLKDPDGNILGIMQPDPTAG